MDSKAWNGEPGAMSYDPEHDPRREPAKEYLACDYCGRELGIGSVTVANVGQWCSRDCRNAHAGRVYMAKMRRVG